MTTTIEYKFSEDGMDLDGFTLSTEEETWTGILLDFVDQLNNRPKEYRFYIDREVLKKHINRASEEMRMNLLKTIDTE